MSPRFRQPNPSLKVIRSLVALVCITLALLAFGFPKAVENTLDSLGLVWNKAPRFISADPDLPRSENRKEATPFLAQTTTRPKFPPYDPDEINIFERDDRRLLWGGLEESDHFDITEARLDDEGFRHGRGRNFFPALLAPQFVTIEEIDLFFKDDAPVLVVDINGDVHAYELYTLMEYEIVNDRVGGQPVMAAFCILAKLGAVYDRQYGEHELTFAVSGYTYREAEVWEGMRSFLLWDRETESLWWPLIGEAVSGSLKEAPLQILDKALWAQLSWGEVKKRYPQAKVLKGHVDFTPPTDWPRLDITTTELMNAVATTRPASESLPPRWGENDKVGNQDGK